MTSQTNRKRRQPTRTTTLKTTIVLGSLMATLIGGEMLASTEPTVETVPASPPAQTIVIPQADGSFTLELAPIPDLVIPEPVARSQSSR